MWCGVVWCGVVWCGVVSCGVVWCGVPKALLPEGNGRDVYPRVQVNGRRCVCGVRAVCKCVVAQPDQCTPALGRPCSADARAHAHRVSLVHCTLRASPAMHCLTAWGQWAVALLQCTAPVPSGQWAVKPLQCTAPLPGGSGQWNFCHTLPHCLGAVGSGTPAMHCHTALGAVGSGPPAMHGLNAWGQWAVQLLQYTAALLGGSGQCNSRSALLHYPQAIGSATPAMHCLTAWGQWAVETLQ